MSLRLLELTFYFAGFLFAAGFVYFLRADDSEWTFPMFVLSASMFFLGYRFKLKARINAREMPSNRSEPDDEADQL